MIWKVISLAESDVASLLTEKCWLFAMEGAGQFGLDAVTINISPMLMKLEVCLIQS